MSSGWRRSCWAVGVAAMLLPGHLSASSTPEELIDAAKRGRLDVVEGLLKQGADPNVGDKNGDTALMDASRTGKVEVVKALLTAGAKPDVKNKKGETAAIRAVFAAQAETLRLLVGAGADVGATNAKGETAFHLAIKNGSANVRPEIVEVLVKAGADAKAERFRGEPALVYAVESLMDRMTEGLLKAGLDANEKSQKGTPAIVLAARHCGLGSGVNMVSRLIVFGADVNARDERNRSAIEHAVDLTSTDYANRGYRDNCGKVAYMLASRGADDRSVWAAREIVIKKSYVLFDTMLVQGQREGSKARASASAPRADSRRAGAAAPRALAGTPKPGGFQYAVAGAGEDEVIQAGTLQYQSTADEHVIGLVQGGAARYAVSLFLPLRPATGLTTLKPYDGKAFKKAPTAAIFIGSGYYYAQSGRLTLDEASNGTISGSFEFAARHERDATRNVTVKGAFKQIPLAERRPR